MSSEHCELHHSDQSQSAIDQNDEETWQEQQEDKDIEGDFSLFPTILSFSHELSVSFHLKKEDAF